MRIVVGVDSGGSKTRAVAVLEDGTPVGYSESGGGNPGHDSRFHENIQSAIIGCIGSHPRESVCAMVSGIAGLDRPTDHEWAEKATAVVGVTGSRLQVNDTEIAHFGAFEGRPGIVCIQGQGSLVLAKTDAGRLLRNFDLFHYANSAAPKLGFRATHAVLSGEPGPQEEEFVRGVLEHWGVSTVEELRETALARCVADRETAMRHAGELAPWVTRAAEMGFPVADRICRLAAFEITEAIRLLGGFFESAEVSYCLGGSCGSSPAVSGFVEEALVGTRYRRIRAAFTPLEGAVLWALELAGVEVTAEVRERLRGVRLES